MELINFDYHLIVEHSETSDNRPFTTSNIISETSFEENNPNILLHDTGQKNLHFNQDDHTVLFQNQEREQFNIVPDQQQDTITLQNVPDLSETATIQNVLEHSDITVNNPRSLTIIIDSKNYKFQYITQYKIQLAIKIKMTLLILQIMTIHLSYLQ